MRRPTALSIAALAFVLGLFVAPAAPHAAATAVPVRRSDGAVLVYAPPAPASAQNPAFSPDSQTLLFTIFHAAYNSGQSGLYTVPISGGVASRLMDVAGHQTVNLPGSCWNAATKRITFASDLVTTDEIWTIAANGGNLFRVTHHSPPLHFIEPSFSPDGQWIVFEADSNAPIAGSVWKVRADGSGLTQLTSGPAAGTDDREPNWSPLGDRIVFQRRVPSVARDVWHLYTMNTDGSGLQQVTAGHSDTDASWSPDGQWIVYSSVYGGLPAANVFIVAASGGTPLRVTTNPRNEEGAASWSADDKWIAFESHRNANGASPAALWRIAVPPLSSLRPKGRH